jgi:membrane-associated phospholipid phosphatase
MYNIIIHVAGNIPFFMGFLSIGLLIFLQEIHLLLFYVGGFIANELLNRVLKPIIQDPRPKPISSTDIYGMPSGHSQLAVYSLVFMTLVLREKHYGYYDAIILLFLGLTVATMAQRVMIEVHSLEQVVIGGLLGGVLGYITYKFARKYITENK